MKIMRGFRAELAPNNSQKTSLLRHCGAARWVYNWGLARKIEAFEAKKQGQKTKIPTAMMLATELRAKRAEIAPWLSECSCYCIDSTLPHCDSAFDSFFSRCKEGAKKKGFPRFKSRKRGSGSVQFHKQYKVEEGRVYLPKIGWVRLKERGYLPPTKAEGVKFYSATIKEKAGRWFVSIQVEVEVSVASKGANNSVVGVDFGIKTLATCSNGKVFKNPKALGKRLKKLARLQRAASRKKLGSKNRAKANRKVATLHARIANIRSDALHNLSNYLVKTKRAVVIEDLNVAGIFKNRHLSRAISDCGFGELRRQIEYKAAWHGCEVVVADRFFPSSKLCSCCGVVNKSLTLAERAWSCQCGARHDRDENAAFNLAAIYWAQQRRYDYVAEAISETLNARGVESSGDLLSSRETFRDESRTGQLLLFEVA